MKCPICNEHMLEIEQHYSCEGAVISVKTGKHRCVTCNGKDKTYREYPKEEEK